MRPRELITLLLPLSFVKGSMRGKNPFPRTLYPPPQHIRTLKFFLELFLKIPQGATKRAPSSAEYIHVCDYAYLQEGAWLVCAMLTRLLYITK